LVPEAETANRVYTGRRINPESEQVLAATSQPGKAVTGKVIFSDTGAPATGASVIVKNSTTGTIVGKDGTFTLELKEKAEVVFSFVGYTSQTLWCEPGEVKQVSLERSTNPIPTLTVVTWGADGRNSRQQVQQPARFMGHSLSMEALNSYIARNLVYPPEEKARGQEGMASVRFTIMEDGSLANITVLQATNENFAKAAREVIETTRSLWTPSTLDGEPQKGGSHIALMVKFSLPVSETEPGVAGKGENAVKERFFIVEEMPLFNGGDPAVEFLKYIGENLRYPKSAAEKGITGRVIVQFTVNSRGKVDEVGVIRGSDPDLDGEALRVVAGSPDWTPGKQKGNPVSVVFTFPVNFSLYDSPPSPKPYVTESGEELFYIVEEMPKFNGGDPKKEFPKFIAENLRYPPEEAANKRSGLVIVQFRILPDGRLANPAVVASAGQYFDAEALRVLNLSPLWTPGKQRGEAVTVLFTFPMHFVVQ
jgi:TonB family protein